MKIAINEPCTENWNEMTPTEQGAFCQVCAKDVIDFTGKNAEEIKWLLSSALGSGKKICGRITNAQLDQFNEEFPGWKNEREAFRTVFVFSLIAVFGLTLFSCNTTASKEIIDQLNVQASELLVEDSLTAETVETNEAKILLDSIGSSEKEQDSLNIKLIDLELAPNQEGWVSIKECIMTLGMVTISGSMIQVPEFILEFDEKVKLVDLYQKKKKEDLTKVTLSNPIPGFPQFPVLPSQPNETIDGILDKTIPVFEAELTPNPIDLSTKLFLNTQLSIQMNVEIFQKNQSTVFRKGEGYLERGSHKLNLRLYRLPAGNYDLVLSALQQTTRIPFTVPSVS